MHVLRGMKPEESPESSTHAADDAPSTPSRRRTAEKFVREHPVLSVIGAATVGLVGGFELAAGAVIGAGVVAFLDRNGRAGDLADGPRGLQGIRARARKLVERTPHEARRRARAIAQAARGRLDVPAPR